ncbi:hypothetical protein [Fusibacter bizertensis]
MQLTGITNQKIISKQTDEIKTQQKEKSFTEILNVAKTPVERNIDDMIGFGSIDGGRQLATAFYAEESTEENPIVILTKGPKGEELARIAINDIDTTFATKTEMFALCSYLDDKGKTDKSAFGSFETLRAVEEMSTHNGFMKTTSDGVRADSVEEKFNWQELTRKVAELVLSSKNMIQYLKVKNLNNAMSQY